jgi:hypothetical protein
LQLSIPSTGLTETSLTSCYYISGSCILHTPNNCTHLISLSLSLSLTHTPTEQSTYSQSRSSYLRHFISITMCKCLVRLYKTCRTTAMKWKSPWIGKEAIIIHQASILKKTTQISKNIQPLNPSLAHPRTVRPSSPSAGTAAQHCTLTCVSKCYLTH